MFTRNEITEELEGKGFNFWNTRYPKYPKILKKLYGSGTEKNFGFGSGIGYPLGTGEQLQAYVRVETFDVTLQELEFVLDGLLIEPFLEPHGGGIGALPLVELVFLFTSATTLLRNWRTSQC